MQKCFALDIKGNTSFNILRAFSKYLIILWLCSWLEYFDHCVQLTGFLISSPKGKVALPKLNISMCWYISLRAIVNLILQLLLSKTRKCLQKMAKVSLIMSERFNSQIINFFTFLCYVIIYLCEFESVFMLKWIS